MRYVEPIEYKNLEEVFNDLDNIANRFLETGIIAIRGVKFNEEDHFKLTTSLGDILGWYPNSDSKEILHKYTEDHGHNEGKKGKSGSDVILNWHLEHVDYDYYCPLVAGVWNMWNFKCDPSAGITYFVDSSEVYNLMTEEEKDFLSKSLVVWADLDESGPHRAKAIQPHWKTGKPVIRIEITDGVKLRLESFDGREPTQEEQEKFQKLNSKFFDIVENNEDIRFYHSWKENDIVIPDLWVMAHAVTGGFDSKDRTFTGYWIFSKDPESLEEDEMPLVWRK